MALRHVRRCCLISHLQCINRPRHVSYRLFSNASNLSSADQTAKQSVNHESEQPLDQTIQSVTKSVSQSSTTSQINASQAESMYKRGIEWFTGQFGRVDYNAALVWFQQAATAQHAPAINRLALMNLLGYGCVKSVDKAIELFRQAAALGDIDAANHLAALLQSSAVAASSKSSKSSKSQSQSDKQSNQDKMREAADLFEQAARGGHSRAALSLAKLILVGNSRPLAYEQALVWLEQAAEAKLSEAAYLAGLIHLHRPPLAPSSNRTMSKSASAVLEQVHASRFQLVPHNVTRGFELLAQAAELGSSDAHCDLGDWYLAGDAPLSSINERTAAAHYRAAAEVGNAVGQARLGMMIAHGVGVNRDRNEALLWLTTSANANNNDAHIGLSYLTLTQPNLHELDTDIVDEKGRRELTEKQRDFVRDLLNKVSESIHAAPSSSSETKAGVLALKRDPWLLVDALQSVEQSTGKPWIKGTDSLMLLVPQTK